MTGYLRYTQISFFQIITMIVPNNQNTYRLLWKKRFTGGLIFTFTLPTSNLVLSNLKL